MENKVSLIKTILIPSLVYFALLIGGILLMTLMPYEYEDLSVLSILSIIVLLFLSVTSLIELISLFFDKSATTNTLLISLCILVSFLAFSSTYLFIPPPNLDDFYFQLVSIVQFQFFLLCIFFFLRFYRLDFNLQLKNIERAILFILYAIASVSNVILSFYHLNYISYCISLVPSLYLFVRFFICDLKIQSNQFFYHFSLLIYLSFVLAEFFETFSSSPFSFPLKGIVVIFFLIIAILFFSIYFVFVIRKTNSSYEKEQYQKRAKELETAILRNQINPHFLFNSLNVIKSQYSKSIQDGNHALNLLSKQLRLYVDSSEVHLINLDKELNSVLNYIELENLKVENPYLIIFNIETTDFDVPFLSILTLIENSVLHSAVNTKKDGFISITTQNLDDSYLLVIEDNGIGFDLSKLNKQGIGIKNTKERFELLLNATFTIESTIGEGTKYTILIPKKVGQAYENINH